MFAQSNTTTVSPLGVNCGFGPKQRLDDQAAGADPGQREARREEYRHGGKTLDQQPAGGGNAFGGGKTDAGEDLRVRPVG